MFFDLLKPQPQAWEEPEEEDDEPVTESRYKQYSDEPDAPDDDEYREQIEYDEELVKTISPFALQIVTRRKWCSMQLAIDRLEKRVRALEFWKQCSADSKYHREAKDRNDKFFEMLEQSVKDAAEIDALNDQLSAKDGRISELMEEKEQLKEQIRSLMNTMSSMASGKAVQRMYVEQEAKEGRGNNGQFTSLGRDREVTEDICYWLMKAGVEADKVKEVAGLKSIDAYSRAGKKRLEKTKAYVKDEAGTHYFFVTELDPVRQEHPDYPYRKIYGYSFPDEVVATIKKLENP